MVPNHIMQLISLTSMEPPISFHADAVRDEQAKILHAIQPLSSEEVLSRTVRGQYGEGIVEGQRVPAYRNEGDVPTDSRTETFVAMKLAIDNWRWADVPFYLRTGKRLAAQTTQIVIQFRRAPFVLFRDTPVENLMPNQLILHIQPEEGIALQFAAKVPGPIMRLGAVDMNFKYADYFGTQPSTGYERLLHDCMIGDATLFQRADMVEAGWCVVSPALDVRNGQFQLVSATVFPSRHYSGLDQIVTEFVKTAGIQPSQACFGIAGPVTHGRVETSNLPWIIEARRLADELKIHQALLINDLEATGWGIGALTADDLVSLNQVTGSGGNQALIAAGTGLGEAGLCWDGARHHVFASEGGHCDFAPVNDLQIELLRY